MSGKRSAGLAVLALCAAWMLSGRETCAAATVQTVGPYPSAVRICSPTGALLRTIRGFSFPVSVCEPEPGLVAVVDLPNGEIVTLTVHGTVIRRCTAPAPVRFAQPLPGGRWLACLEGPEQIVELAPDGTLLHRYEARFDRLVAALRRADGSLVAADNGPPPRVVALSPDGAPRATFADGLIDVGALALQADGTLIAASYDDTLLVGLDDALHPVWRDRHPGHCTGIAARPDGALALALPDAFIVRVLDVARRATLDIPSHEPPFAVCFLSSGDLAIGVRHRPEPARLGATARAAEPAWLRADGPFLWTLAGVALALVIGFALRRTEQRAPATPMLSTESTQTPADVPQWTWLALAVLAAAGWFCQRQVAARIDSGIQWPWLIGFAGTAVAAALCLRRFAPPSGAGRWPRLAEPLEPADGNTWATLALAVLASGAATWLEAVSPGDPRAVGLYACGLVLALLAAVEMRRVRSPAALRCFVGSDSDGSAATCHGGQASPSRLCQEGGQDRQEGQLLGEMYAFFSKHARLLAAAAFAFLVGLAFRNLDGCPRNVHHDMAWCYNSSLDLLTGSGQTFFSHGYYEIPRPSFVPSAATMALAGRTLAGARLAPALAGLATVLLTFLLCRRRLGETTAWLAALALAACHAHLHFARLAAYIEPLPFQLLALHCLLDGLERRRMQPFIGAGLAGGVSLLLYYAGRATPIVLVLALLVVAGRHRQRLVALWPGLLAALLAAGVALGPMLPFELSHPAGAAGRTLSVLPFLAPEGIDWRALASTLAQGVPRTLGLLVGVSDTSTQYAPGVPLLFGIGPVLAAWGLLYALLCWRSPVFRVLLVWLGVVFLLGSALTIDPPFWPRILGGFVALHIVLAVPAGILLCAAARARAQVPKLLGSVLLVLLAAMAVQHVHFYLGRFCAGRSAQGRPAFDRTWTEVNIGREIAALDPGVRCYLLAPPGSPVSCEHGSIRFLANRHDVSDLFDVRTALPPAHQRTAFFIVPGREDDVAVLREAVPGAVVEERANRVGEFQYWSVRVERRRTQ